ncbi:MAG TPA: hypothetical protein VJ698_18660 [Noviherbaspirillum sp.]|uniref:hypothetical protein n=1 Tax=Noviherbaspirillum sp. TaxID=1926288 RepID=UPI002B4A0A93|nr:hypothetical protein [Noviherbaspirillum sp.]HJV87498.1 hypothetical protein [Noviherbaspirillum sp.]
MDKPTYKKLLLSCLSIFLSSTLYAQSLCTESEKAIFSFKETRSRKFMSICEGSSASYLTYRFGTKEKIELQYPGQLDEHAWKKFEFSGIRRGGGKENAGFGAYTLTFVNGKTEYVVFQEWNDEDETYSIGINIQTPGKTTVLLGDRLTQKGSLVLLETPGARIRNLENP